MPHQQRVLEKLKASGGVLAAHEVGSGKTLTSLAAKDALGLPLEAITPAALVNNYGKEVQKHFDEAPEDIRVRSYERAVRNPDIDPGSLVVLDEAHRARNSGTQLSRKLLPEVINAKARLLLTGTPVYNNPADLAPLINTAAGKQVLPTGRGFEGAYIGEKAVKPETIDRLRGWLMSYPVTEGKKKVLKNKKDLVNKLVGYVDVHRNDGTDFPSRIDETHRVPMSEAQMRAYKFVSGDIPWDVRMKMESGLPLNKRESRDLNAFQGAMRQASNTARPYNAKMTDAEEDKSTPKMQAVLNHLLEMQKKNPEHRGVIYSNYLDAGVRPISRLLAAKKIQHNVFTGELNDAERKRIVDEYNSGKVRTLLLSGAGSEGLDLKGTRSIQLLEPHWNNSRLNQVIGRGIRYKSHEHLDEKDRNVRVMRYLSTLNPGLKDKLLNAVRTKPKQSIEEYLSSMSADKDELSNALANAMQEASDKGPMKKTSADKLTPEQLAELAKLTKSTQYNMWNGDPVLQRDHAGASSDAMVDPESMHYRLHKEYGGDLPTMAAALDKDWSRDAEYDYPTTPKAIAGQRIGNAVGLGFTGSMLGGIGGALGGGLLGTLLKRKDPSQMARIGGLGGALAGAVYGGRKGYRDFDEKAPYAGGYHEYYGALEPYEQGHRSYNAGHAAAASEHASRLRREEQNDSYRDYGGGDDVYVDTYGGMRRPRYRPGYGF